MYPFNQFEFDYIVVGGGSSGATLASRLSENTALSVCLIEAGGKDKHPLIHIPFGISLLTRLRYINWHYNTTPQSELDNRSLFWPRGRTLGGSSSINAMCYIRGATEDYDHWQALGAEGWGWQDVLPYFRKSEHFEHGADEFHGSDGPLSVNDLRYTNPLSRAFVEAAGHVGEKVLKDFNRQDRTGLGFYQVTQRGGQRCSSAKAYLKPARKRKNLTIMTDCHVEKVLIKSTEGANSSAHGIQVSHQGMSYTLNARREVILSAGAINSPQLLMLSGIGPKAHLEQVGVEVKKDLPGVGQNLQDHLDAIVQHRCKVREGYAVALSALPKYAIASVNYLFRRMGIFSSNIAEAGGFVKSQHANGIPDLQYHFLPAILEDHGRQIVMGYGFGLHVCCLYPKSRGEIKLRSKYAADHPHIDPKYLTHPDDVKVMIDGVRKARDILNCPTFRRYQSKEFYPGTDIQSDDDILAFIRKKAETIYHPIGTCKMGADSDPMAVVDNKLKVRGVDNLRVVDASVMPTLVGGNTNAPSIMIAERAAEFVLQDYASGRGA